MDTQDVFSLIIYILIILMLFILSLHGLGYLFIRYFKKPHWAMVLYGVLIKISPTRSSVSSGYINRSLAHLNLKEYQLAIQDCNDALALNSSKPMGYNNRGVAYLKLKQYQQALHDYNRAIQLNPILLIAYSNRSFLYIQLQEYQLALQDAEYVLRVQRANFLAHTLSVVCYVYMGQYQQAIERCEEAFKLKPNDATCYHNRGIAYLALNNIEQGKADLLKSQELDPGNSSHGLMVEWYRLGFEQPDEGMAERLETLASLATNDEEQYKPYVRHGIALWLRERFEDALAELEQALLLESNSGEIYFWVGMVCASLGRNEEARLAIEHALKLKLPPVMLRPLYLLEQKQPEFFKQYALPLLTNAVKSE